jgi:hypothetical protein
VARRTMILKRVDPWSVLKFGFIVNLCLMAVIALALVIAWLSVRQLGIIEQACQLALDVGFEECAVDGEALFRVLLIVAGLGTIILTGIVVFSAFLHNLLAELVGGFRFTLIEEGARREAVVRTPSGKTEARAEAAPESEPEDKDDRDREEDTVRSGASGTVGSAEPRWALGTPPPQRGAAGGNISAASSHEDALFRRGGA